MRAAPKAGDRKRPEENRKLLGGGDGDIKVGNFRDPALAPMSHLILPTHRSHSNNNQLPLFGMLSRTVRHSLHTNRMKFCEAK